MHFSRPVLFGVAAAAVAIVVTTTMDGTGLTAFSALPLLPIALALWWLVGGDRRSVGLVVGSARSYLIAAAYPLLVIGLATTIALGAGAGTIARIDWPTTIRQVAIAATATIVVAVLTEEGFFRGALWRALNRGDDTGWRTVLWTSVAFALWHISAVTLPTGFDLPRAEIPVFLVNAAVMGAIWGTLRFASGSIVVSSVSHGIWNGLTYVLFGYGRRTGALGVARVDIYGTEIGFVGLLLNVLALALLAGIIFRRTNVAASTS